MSDKKELYKRALERHNAPFILRVNITEICPACGKQIPMKYNDWLDHFYKDKPVTCPHCGEEFVIEEDVNENT